MGKQRIERACVPFALIEAMKEVYSNANSIIIIQYQIHPKNYTDSRMRIFGVFVFFLRGAIGLSGTFTNTKRRIEP
jgi:hypothetical protein